MLKCGHEVRAPAGDPRSHRPVPRVVLLLSPLTLQLLRRSAARAPPLLPGRPARKASTMPVEFPGIGGGDTRDGPETAPRPAPGPRRLAARSVRAHRRYGWDRVLLASGSGSAAPARAAAPPANRAGERDGEPESPALKVITTRHPGRWVATAAVAVLLAMVVNSLITNPRLGVGRRRRLPAPRSRSSAGGRHHARADRDHRRRLGFALGTVLALMRLSKHPLLQAVSWGYTWAVPLGAADPAAAALVQPRLPLPAAWPSASRSARVRRRRDAVT